MKHLLDQPHFILSVENPAVIGKTTAQKLVNFDPGMEYYRNMYDATFTNFAKKQGNEGHTFSSPSSSNGVVKNLGAQEGKGADPFVKEHEGFHYLMNHISEKNKINKLDAYKKINSVIPEDVKKVLKQVLVLRGYEDPNSHESEMIPALRDSLVHQPWRDQVLSYVPKLQHQSFMNKMKIAFMDVRNFANEASISDLMKAERDNFLEELKKSGKIVLNGTSNSLNKSEKKMAAEEKKQTQADSDKDEEKRLKKIIESGIEVLKHKLGKVPDLAAVQEMLQKDPTPEQSVSQAMSQSIPADVSPKSQTSSDAAPEAQAGQEQEQKELLPRIFRLKVLYGMSDGEDGSRKPDPSKILYYQDPESGHTFDCESGMWHEQPLSITSHLNSRPISYHEADIVAAIANGVMDDDDYAAMEKSNLLMDSPKKIWKLRKNAEAQLAALEKSEPEKMAKAVNPSEDGAEALSDTESVVDDGSSDQGSGQSNFGSEDDDLPEFGAEIQDEETLIGEDILAQIMEVAFSKVDEHLAEMVRAIVREELAASRGESMEAPMEPEQQPLEESVGEVPVLE